MSRQPSPELARRAVAYDRVIEALQAVADMSRDDLSIAREALRVGATDSWLREAPRMALRVIAAMALDDRALNDELAALDDPA